MSSTTSAGHPAPAHSRRKRVVAAVSAAALTTASLGALALAGSAPAAASTPRAQSVGRFVDGSLGGKPIQQLVDVKDARAKAPGTQSVQNPLEARVLGSLDIPLTGALQLPGPGATSTGAVNQVAVAKTNGYSYGASGAVLNSGGVSLGGSNGSFPNDARLTLSAAALSSLSGGATPSIPVPGAGDAAALGSLTLDVGAVAALAQTKTGGSAVTPHYGIAGLRLTLGSPALAGLLKQLAKGSSALSGLLKLLPSSGLPTGCDLTAGQVPRALSLDGGAVTLDATTGSVVVDLGALLHTLGLDLNSLPANTDLLGYLVAKLPSVLSHGLESVVNGITAPLAKLGKDCIPALSTVIDALTTGQKTLETTINSIAATLTSSGAGGLGALTDGLEQVLKIGANVQSGPGKAADNTTHRYTSALAATPDQATPVVDGQTLVRALEIQVGGSSGAVVALANAAAGPASAAPGTPTTPATSLPPNSAVPNAIPAGQGPIDHGSNLPLTLLVAGLVLGAAGLGVWRLRLRRQG